MDFEFFHPQTIKEFDEYFDLRWCILRKPLGQPNGSEKDELESIVFHLGVYINDKLIGIGRFHFNSPIETQVRQMVVIEQC